MQHSRCYIGAPTFANAPKWIHGSQNWMFEFNLTWIRTLYGMFEENSKRISPHIERGLYVNSFHSLFLPFYIFTNNSHNSICFQNRNVDNPIASENFIPRIRICFWFKIREPSKREKDGNDEMEKIDEAYKTIIVSIECLNAMLQSWKIHFLP